MRERTSPTAAKASPRRTAVSMDVVLLTPHGKTLATLLRRIPDLRSRERWMLPWDGARADESLENAADRIARDALGTAPGWLEQVGAFGDVRRHPGESDLSIAFVGLVAAGAPAPVGGDEAWFPLGDLPALPPRHRQVIDAAFDTVRLRLDQYPIAFRLLPATFTLSDLQGIYEMLLGRRLHKASFRRALQSSWLVEPTDEWRSEGRGRPAQLFRFAPRKRRGNRRGVRFDMLSG